MDNQPALPDLTEPELDTPTNIPRKQVAAPDPTATLEVEGEKPPKDSSQNPFSFLGIPTSLEEARARGFKHYLAKIVSLILIIHGLSKIFEELYQIFFVFPKIPELYKSLNFSDEFYKGLLYRGLITSATGIINTIYGVALAFKHSKVVEYLHIIAGIGLLLITNYLLQKVPAIDIERVTEHGIAFLL